MLLQCIAINVKKTSYWIFRRKNTESITIVTLADERHGLPRATAHGNPRGC